MKGWKRELKERNREDNHVGWPKAIFGLDEAAGMYSARRYKFLRMTVLLVHDHENV